MKNSFVSSVAYNNPQFDGGLYPAGTLATLTCADLKAHAAPDAVICFDGIMMVVKLGDI